MPAVHQEGESGAAVPGHGRCFPGAPAFASRSCRLKTVCDCTPSLPGSTPWKSIKRGSTTDLEARLFENARRMGKEYRARFHLHTMDDVMRMSRVIYRLLEIDFHGDPGGEVLVRTLFLQRLLFEPSLPAGLCRWTPGCWPGCRVGADSAFRGALPRAHPAARRI